MNKHEIRSVIESNVRASRTFNATIAATKGTERDIARINKRRLGASTRALLLAYALVRGVAYARVESTRTRTEPEVHAVARASGAVPAAVRAWLSGERVAAAPPQNVEAA